MPTMNDNLILIAGATSTGKSLSLMDIKDPTGVMYLNCEGKKLPFKSQFQEHTIVDPNQVYQAFTHAETLPEVHTIVIDSLTFLMDMYESVHVLPSADTQKAWGNYAQFFKVLMSQYVAKSTKNVVFTAHTLDILDNKSMSMTNKIKVKGSLMNNGIEAFFSTVIGTTKMATIALEPYGSDLLTITEEDEMLGFKYVFQTKLTKETIGHTIRSPMMMWDNKETYIDNNLQNVIDRLHVYYK